MEKIEVVHNPRCRKSRESLAFLEDKGLEFETRLYLEEKLDKTELSEILKKLGIQAMDLMRKGEPDFKEFIRGKELSEDEMIEQMVAHPKLIERPIVIRGSKAVVARPAEKIEELLWALAFVAQPFGH